MKRIYDKNELHFALLWIGIYILLMSVGDSVSGQIGIAKIVTAPVCIVLAAILFGWIGQNGLREKYGLCPFQENRKRYLYFVPLVLLVSTNLWGGVRFHLTIGESILYVISMLCVGFLEEVIFRGFLFRAMSRTSVKRAVFVSSLTFGAGHILNLLSGRDVAETLLQICYAFAIGFLFTILFYKGKSLRPCIITHGVLNSLSAFSNDTKESMVMDLAASAFLCVVSLGYAWYILRTERNQYLEGQTPV